MNRLTCRRDSVAKGKLGRCGLSHLTAVAVAVLSTAAAVPALAAQTFYTCKSIGVAVYAERIHVQCDKPASGGFSYFALSTTNSAHAARILSVLTAAHLAGRNIVVLYDPGDTSGTAFGCAANDCRRLISVGLQ